MNIGDYQKYISEETMMGPNCVRILKELLDRCPMRFSPDDMILDLGCGKGLTSLVLAKETGARVCADDLWISENENMVRFVKWGVDRQVTPLRADANDLRFEEKQFSAMFSVDSYHYFAGREGFFESRIMPFIRDGGTALIGVPGIRDEFEGRCAELLSDWLGEDSRMFKGPKLWRELIGGGGRIEYVKTWEMACFDKAWSDWLAVDNSFANGDRQYFDTVIRPYTCFVGIKVRLK